MPNKISINQADVYVTVNHGSQTQRTNISHEVVHHFTCVLRNFTLTAQMLNPVFNSSIELWDGETSETIEFIVRIIFRFGKPR